MYREIVPSYKGDRLETFGTNCPYCGGVLESSSYDTEVLICPRCGYLQPPLEKTEF